MTANIGNPGSEDSNLLSPFTLEVNGFKLRVSAWQLLQWKHALRLEAKGMTLSRGQKVSTFLKKRLGFKRTTKIEVLSELVEATLEEVTHVKDNP